MVHFGGVVVDRYNQLSESENEANNDNITNNNNTTSEKLTEATTSGNDTANNNNNNNINNNNYSYNNNNYNQLNSNAKLAAMVFGIFCLFFLYGFGMSFIGFPDNFKNDYDLLPGESVVINPLVNELWYKRAEVYTSDHNDEDAPPMGVYYYSKCPSPQKIRKTAFVTTLDDRGVHKEAFHLLKGTTMEVQWETSVGSTIRFYSSPYYQRTPLFRTRENNFTWTMTYSGKLYVEWKPHSHSSERRFQGTASFDFNLRAFDHDEAYKMCKLDDLSCKEEITDSKECAVIDIIDFSPFKSATFSPASLSSFLHVSFTRDGGKYFLIVPFPILIICLSFFLVAVYSGCCCGRKDTERVDPPGTI